MTIQAYPNLSVSPRIKPHAKRLPPEHVQTVPLQEQFTGPFPPRDERPAALVLAECLSGADPASPAGLFIP
jgi:hypothetical protein